MKKFIYLLTYLLFAWIALVHTSCKKDPIDWYAPVGPPLSAYVKFVNAVPDSKLDFYGYYTKLVSGVTYSLDQPYTNSPFGNITVYATNFNQTTNRITASTSSNNPQMNGQGLWADHHQTMIACPTADTANLPKGTLPETMILLRDNLEAPASGKSHIRFVHLAQRGSTQIKKVDLTTTAGPGSPATVFSALTYQVPSNAVRIDPAKGLATPGLGVFTSGPFTSIDAGLYDFEVKGSVAGESIVTKTNLELKEGKIYTFYTTGTIGSPAALKFNTLLHN